MEEPKVGKKEYQRYRGITEKSKALLFLLREAPYITLADAKRFFYPTHKTLSYAREMIRVLVKNKLVGKYLLGHGLFIYYLTEIGRRISEFFLEAKPKFDSSTKSFYYLQKPTKPSEASAFFIFPSHGLEFYSFTPRFLYAHPFLHTRSLLELSVLFRQTFRFLHVLWLDEIKAKKTSLNLSCHPDLLLCNDLSTEEGRVFVEFENSRIRDLDFLEKVHHLSAHPADWYLFLASSEEIFHNLGRLVRKILMGEAKVNHETLFFNSRAQAALSKNILFGLWQPSFKTDKPMRKIKDLDLFRYDHEVFDKKVWLTPKRDPQAQGLEVREQPVKQLQTVGYSGRKLGKRTWTFGEILEGYKDSFTRALRNAMAGNENLGLREANKKKGTPS